MFLVPIVQLAVCLLILSWLLKQKPGERFSKKAVWRFLLFGALSAIVLIALSLASPIKKDAFFDLHPLLSGFLTALLTAALLEEVLKYLLFRLAIRKNSEVRCWQDAILAAVIVAIGFTLLEDLTYLFDGAGSILRALLPAHLLFQAVMGYFYGKARVTKQAKYHVLSLAVPILLHTLFDMFLIAIMSITGDPLAMANMTEKELFALPYAEWLFPLLACAAVVAVGTLIAMIVFAVKLHKWKQNGEKQELLQEEK